MDIEERTVKDIKKAIVNMLWFVSEDLEELESYVVGEYDPDHGLFTAQADLLVLQESIKKIELIE